MKITKYGTFTFNEKGSTIACNGFSFDTEWGRSITYHDVLGMLIDQIKSIQDDLDPGIVLYEAEQVLAEKGVVYLKKRCSDDIKETK